MKLCLIRKVTVSETIAARKHLPTGTVTFLFTDIEGSTERWERHREQMKAAVRRHGEILQAAIEAHDGQRLQDGRRRVLRGVSQRR